MWQVITDTPRACIRSREVTPLERAIFVTRAALIGSPSAVARSNLFRLTVESASAYSHKARTKWLGREDSNL